MSFYRDAIRKAKKDHKCNVCHGQIVKGEKYHDKAGNQDGVIWESKECETCQPLILEFMQTDRSDEGYCDEWIHEWWRDVFCYDCQKHYLPCEPDEHCTVESGLPCEYKTKYGTCEAGDTCDDMTHYCRCENYISAEVAPCENP